MSNSVTHNIAKVHARINAAEKLAGRTRGIVQLIAVSKTRSANEIREAVAAGSNHFGENYLQEALDKQRDLTDLPIIWHFIGPIQSNKTASIAQHFDWVHSVDRLKIARRLSEQRSRAALLNVCIQVNISAEDSKSGVTLDQVAPLAESISNLPNLKLRGFMAIPSPQLSDEQLYQQFSSLEKLRHTLNQQGFALDTLSIGMSNDLECAIRAGATMVRIGTAIFGPRTTNKQQV